MYVIEEVKKVDLHCGGPTQIAVLNARGVERNSEADLQMIVGELGSADAAIKAMWKVLSKGPKGMQELKRAMEGKSQAAASSG